MGVIENILKKTRKKGPQDLVAIDLDPTGVRCVRVKKTGDGIALLAAGSFPAVEFSPDVLAGTTSLSAL